MNVYKTIKKGSAFYRYDVIRPPKDVWSKDFKSPLYNHYKYEIGPKNEIGAFFFFEDKKSAIEIGQYVLSVKKKLIENYNSELNLWITETNNEDELCMLDISECKDVVELYKCLWHEHLDIFKDDFYLVRDLLPTICLSSIKDNIVYLTTYKEEFDPYTYQKYECDIRNLFCNLSDENKLGYACQQLTDFSNGKIFKDLLVDKGLDGYIFCESNAIVYCLFSSDKLSLPITRLL